MGTVERLGARNVSGFLQQPHRSWNAWTTAGLPGGVSSAFPQSLDSPAAGVGSRLDAETHLIEYGIVYELRRAVMHDDLPQHRWRLRRFMPD
jgi:hypothetical protein